MKQLQLFNQVYSMMTFTKLLEYLYEIVTCENAVGNKWGEREQQINGVRDGTSDRNGNIVGWKWPLVKKDN